MRLGVFGGSFDPVHLGHLLLAESCREQASLDRVVFMPTHIQPHKQGHRPAPDAARVEMLKLAIGGNPGFELSTHEVDRGGVSYTVETLRALREERPDAELFFLLGADSLTDFPKWREPANICALATLLVVRRAGLPEPTWDGLNEFASPERIAAMRAMQIEMPQIEISATEIRRRVAAGRSIGYRVPNAVESLIATRGLYRDD